MNIRLSLAPLSGLSYRRSKIQLIAAVTFILFFFIGQPAQGQVFDFNLQCQQAYKEIIHLKLKNGQHLIDQEKRNNPNNLIPYFLENYIDFFVLFFNEDPTEYKVRIKNLDKRLEMINKGSEKSPYFLFVKSVIHIQWAAVKIKFGYNWDAGWEIRRAYLQIKENVESFPSFTPNRIFYGALQVAVGNIPEGYKWLGNLFGMKGSIKSGMESLRFFLETNSELSAVFHDEAAFYYLFLKFYMENDRDGVFEYISKENLDIKNNHLLTYLAVNLSINNQQCEAARRILRERNTSEDYLATSAWDLEMGYIAINALEADAAKYFERFLQSFKGKFYLKDALQKLSWHYYLQGNQTQANYYRKEVLAQGATLTDADQQALKEARTGKWPNKLLLRARLLNDGGHYNEALRLLSGKRIVDFTVPEEKLEFAYRVGRIYDDMGRDDEAINFYKQAIVLGEFRKEHYAARAALHLGYIFEQKGDKEAAVKWFERCLKMDEHDFKNSLDQRAKAGIERCTE